jgi:predicted dehydrogenase
MGSNRKLDRREFIKRSAATSAGAALAAHLKTSAEAKPTFPQDSPNGRVTVGFIGTGARAQQLMDEMRGIAGLEVIALCDAYRGRLERAGERVRGKAKVYRDHQELLASSGVDAVFVVTPDHLHKTHVLAALNAGKDVYCEKPMTYRVDEGLEIIEAVKKTKRVLQVGSQGISSAIQQKARDVIASGKLGQITMIRASYNRNTAGGAWIYPIPPDASPETVNWEMFLGNAPKKPFNLEHFFRWRCYEDYSGGVATDLFVHLLTTVHFIMGAKMADAVVAMGSLDRWRGSRDTPDTLNAVVRYPEGFTLNLSATLNNESASESGVQILGTKGTLQLGGELALTPELAIEDNGWIVQSWPRALEEAYYRDPKVQQTEMVRRWPPQVIEGSQRWQSIGRRDASIHIENFLRAVHSRQQPNEDASAGHHAAAVAHMINLAAKEKRLIQWDQAADKLKA